MKSLVHVCCLRRYICCLVCRPGSFDSVWLGLGNKSYVGPRRMYVVLCWSNVATEDLVRFLKYKQLHVINVTLRYR